jgi:IclR family pca regulon transcriptional regulator
MPLQKKRTADRYIVPAVEQASRLLYCLAGARTTHLSLIEICGQVGIHKSKAFSILHTLEKFGLVQRNTQRKGYALGPGLITLSRRVLDDLNAPRLAEPILEELARTAGGTAILGLITDNNVFVAAKHEGEHDIGVTIRVGRRFPLTYGSHGKAIAAFLPQKELDRILNDGNLYFHGKPEHFDMARFSEELARCRRDGFAVDLGEIMPGLNSAAAPILGPGGTPIGYIVVMGLFPAEAAWKFGPLVAEAGKALSRQLGADVDSLKVETHQLPNQVDDRRKRYGNEKKKAV